MFPTLLSIGKELPVWVRVLASACLGSHDPHMTFIAMETLLKLLEQSWLCSLATMGALGRGGGGTPLPVCEDIPPPLILTSIVSALVGKSMFVRVSVWTGHSTCT